MIRDDDEDLLLIDEEDLAEAPDLPETASEPQGHALDVARFCPSCKAEARIVSNHLGRRAYCGPCKNNWPIGPTTASTLPMVPDRGFHKQTTVEPDYQLAYEDLDITPKKPKRKK